MTENHLVTLFAWLFGWAWDEMGQKGQCLAQKKANFWPKKPTFGQIWPKNPLFWGEGEKLLVPAYQGTNETPISC